MARLMGGRNISGISSAAAGVVVDWEGGAIYMLCLSVEGRSSTGSLLVEYLVVGRAFTV
jgi:hypothetical protein